MPVVLGGSDANDCLCQQRLFTFDAIEQTNLSVPHYVCLRYSIVSLAAVDDLMTMGSIELAIFNCGLSLSQTV